MHALKSIQLGSCRYKAPELLFRPDLVGDESEGIHEILSNSIVKSDMDLRKTLYQNIVFSGGSTLIKGKNLYKIKSSNFNNNFNHNKHIIF